jgi:hypothetical protein
MVNSSRFLRMMLLADAVLSGASAVVLLAGAEALEAPLGLSASFLRGAGLSLVPFVAMLVYLLTRDTLPRAAVLFVIGCNVLWAADSVLLLFTNWIDPTMLGQTLLIAQAVGVAVVAEVQYVALRRVTA